MEQYQISLDDIERQNILGNEPIRYAFIDEFGGFGFDFSKPSTSKYLPILKKTETKYIAI